MLGLIRSCRWQSIQKSYYQIGCITKLSRLVTRNGYQTILDSPSNTSSNETENIPVSEKANDAKAKSRTGVLWLENIFPFKHPLLDPRARWIERYSGKYMQNHRYDQFIPTKFPNGAEFAITSAQHNLKEGGIYVRFSYKNGSIAEAVQCIQDHIEKVNEPLFFEFLKVRAYQVKGTPWVEDLVSRVPTNRLHVQFLGPDLTVEDLYQEFRVFGRIMDIALQPSTDKEVPRYASVQFLNKRSATSARNCIHGERFGDTCLQIGYEKVIFFNVGTTLVAKNRKLGW